jgi:hypothetical protein
MSPSQQENSVLVRLSHQWLRGLGLWFRIGLLFWVAWVLPSRLGDVWQEIRGLTECDHIVPILFCLAMLICCPLAIERLTRRFGIRMPTTTPGSADRPSGENVRTGQ